MPQISCSAHTCVHNAESKCCLQDVRVGGSDAKKACQTCCDSFREKTEGFANAACASCACSDSHVDRINVEGVGACNCNDTECKTFKK